MNCKFTFIFRLNDMMSGGKTILQFAASNVTILIYCHAQRAELEEPLSLVTQYTPFSSQWLYWGHGINQVPWSSFSLPGIKRITQHLYFWRP